MVVPTANEREQTMDIKMGRKKVNEVAEQQSSATSKSAEPGKKEKENGGKTGSSS